MAINHSNITNFNSGQWHIVVQKRDTPSRLKPSCQRQPYKELLRESFMLTDSLNCSSRQ